MTRSRRPPVDWSPLREPGDHVLVPGADARSVSTLARLHVERLLGRSVLLATRSTPAGAFVALAYVYPEAAVETSATRPPPVYSGASVDYDEPEVDEDDAADDEDAGSASSGGGYSLEDET